MPNFSHNSNKQMYECLKRQHTALFQLVDRNKKHFALTPLIVNSTRLGAEVLCLVDPGLKKQSSIYLDQTERIH